jgi:cytochrome P450
VMFGLIVAIFGAGHAPGIALIALTLLTLLEFPDEMKRLRENPQLLPGCVEEGLRFVTPTTAPNPLAALEDIELGGKTIRKGDAVTVILAAANRDPAVFAEPERFDISRSPNRHLAFSLGEHYCLGTMLSRETAQCALGSLVMRLDDLKLGCDKSELEWVPHDRFRVLEKLPVRFRPV